MAVFVTDTEGWDRPKHLLQGELFTKPRDMMLALASVSIEEMDDWRAFGWISYDVRDIAAMDTAQIGEMALVRNVARSGLTRAQVTALLKELPKPYRYNPLRVAYCFGHGWVELPMLPTATELDEYMEANIDAWLSKLGLLENRSMLRYLHGRTMQVLLTIPRRKGEEDEEES